MTLGQRVGVEGGFVVPPPPGFLVVVGPEGVVLGSGSPPSMQPAFIGQSQT